MEEIVTIDGRQFKLTLDRPLTASERQQVIADIRKQSGCGTCGSKVANLSNDWQYGGVRSMNVPQTPSATVTCPTLKQSTDDITLGVTPTGGVGPYKAWFYIKHNTGAPSLIPTGRLSDTTAGTSYTGGVSTSSPNPLSWIIEGQPASVVYTLDDADVSSATGDSTSGTAFQPSDVDDTGTLSFNLTPLNLAIGSIRFISAIRDSCAASGGPGTCVQWCDVTTQCAAPSCGFVVS